MITRGGSGLAVGNAPIAAGAGSARAGAVCCTGVCALSGYAGITGTVRNSFGTSRGSARRSYGACMVPPRTRGSARCGNGKIPSGTGRGVGSPPIG